MGRQPNGTIIPDPAKFPNGIEEFIAYIHGLGLKFGLYSDAGTNTCAGRPGVRTTQPASGTDVHVMEASCGRNGVTAAVYTLRV